MASNAYREPFTTAEGSAPPRSSAAFLSRAIKRHEQEAVTQALSNQSRRSRKEIERAEQLRIVRKMQKEMQS